MSAAVDSQQLHLLLRMPQRLLRGLATTTPQRH
jgi:hypothetical protein